MKHAELETLIFCSGGSCFGIDIEQIAQMAEADCDSDGLTFRQLLGEPPGAACGAMKRIYIKARERVSILIPEPEEVIRLPLCDLRQLPDSFRAAQSFGVWAVAISNGRMIVLLDLYKNRTVNALEDAADRM